MDDKTVKLKAVAEKAIRSSMREVSERLPDLEVYRRIYPDPRLGEMLAEAYRDVILFARKVTVYCQGYGLSKWHARSFLRKLIVVSKVCLSCTKA